MLRGRAWGLTTGIGGCKTVYSDQIGFAPLHIASYAGILSPAVSGSTRATVAGERTAKSFKDCVVAPPAVVTSLSSSSTMWRQATRPAAELR
jgi:hypothetical protein